MVQIFSDISDIGINGDLVFPFKLGPELSELGFLTGCWMNVVHDIDWDFVQNDTASVGASTGDVISDVTKNNSVFG